MAAKRKAADAKSSPQQPRRVDSFRLPSVCIEGRHLRFLLMHRNKTFDVSGDMTQPDWQPLFVGTDVLAGIKQDTKNHTRIHARFALQGLATKLILTDVRIEGIHNSSTVWFYSVLGMFRAVFEYHSLSVQKHCLQYFTDIWLRVSTEAELEETYKVTPSNVASSLAAEVHGLQHSETYSCTPMSEILASELSIVDEDLASVCNDELEYATDKQERKQGRPLQCVHSDAELSPSRGENLFNLSASGNHELQTSCEGSSSGCKSVKTEPDCEFYVQDEVAVEHGRLATTDMVDESYKFSRETEIPHPRQYKLSCDQCLLCSQRTNKSRVDVNSFSLSDVISRWMHYIQQVRDAFGKKLKVETDNESGPKRSSGARQKPGTNNATGKANTPTKERHNAEDNHLQFVLHQIDYVELVLDFVLHSLRFMQPALDLSILSQLLCLVATTVETAFTPDSTASDKWTNLPVGKLAALTTFSRWLGEEFHRMEPVISQRVAAFKQAHIDDICNLPPAEDVVQELFPSCMVELAHRWTGLQKLQSAHSSQMDHSYEQKGKVIERWPTQNRNLFPVIQLILELANNTLVSGVAHVVYCQLRHAS